MQLETDQISHEFDANIAFQNFTSQLNQGLETAMLGTFWHFFAIHQNPSIVIYSTFPGEVKIVSGRQRCHVNCCFLTFPKMLVASISWGMYDFQDDSDGHVSEFMAEQPRAMLVFTSVYYIL